MNLIEMVERNQSHIKHCVDKYKLDISAEELLNLANIYSQHNFFDLTIRIVGEIKVEKVVEVEKGSAIRVETIVKYKKIPIYSFTKRNVKDVGNNRAIDIFKDIFLIGLYHAELKSIKKLEELENSANVVFNLELMHQNFSSLKI